MMREVSIHHHNEVSCRMLEAVYICSACRRHTLTFNSSSETRLFWQEDCTFWSTGSDFGLTVTNAGPSSVVKAHLSPAFQAVS